MRAHKIERLLDVRLNNASQLAGFSKRNDLEYFLRTICGADYHHELALAPVAEMLDAYKAKQLSWSDYAAAYRDLIERRHVEESLPIDEFRRQRTILLCSEHTADHCHRRVAAEYLASKWHDVEIVHI